MEARLQAEKVNISLRIEAIRTRIETQAVNDAQVQIQKEAEIEVKTVPEYEDLFDLLYFCADAREFFNGLPDYLQRFMSYRADKIKTLPCLLAYGKHLERGSTYPVLTFGPPHYLDEDTVPFCPCRAQFAGRR